MLADIFQMVDTTTKTSLMKLQKDTISIQFSGGLVQLFDFAGRPGHCGTCSLRWSLVLLSPDSSKTIRPNIISNDFVWVLA